MTKIFDLEERTFQFAKDVYLLCKKSEDTGFNSEFDILIQESIELTKIFSSIVEKSK